MKVSHLSDDSVRLFGKGKKERIVPISHPIQCRIRELLACRPVDSDLVFPNEHGQPLNRFSAHRRLKLLCAKVGMRATGLHF